MSIPKVANADMRYRVRNLEEFINHNQTVFAEDREHCYVVFSYGYHFPMYLWDKRTKTWFANEDKYSVTTSRHMGQTRPSCVYMLQVNTQTLCKIANGEYDHIGNEILRALALNGGDYNAETRT